MRPSLTGGAAVGGLDTDLRASTDLSLARVLRTLLRRRRLILACMAVGIAIALILGWVLPKRYAGEALVQLVFDDSAGPAAAGPSGGPAIVLDAAALVKGETEIIASRAVARRVLASSPVAAAFARDRSAKGRDPVLALQKPLAVLNDGKSYLVRIRFEADSAGTAATIANAFADAYQATRAQEGANVLKERATQLQRWTEQAERDADAASLAMQDFAEQTTVSIPAAGATSAADQQMRDLIAQLSARQALRREKELRVERLRQAAELGMPPLDADLDGTSEAKRLIEAEVAARRDLALLGTSLGTRHPRYQQAQARLTALEASRASVLQGALAQAQSDLLSARIGEQALLADVARLHRSMIGDGPQLQKALQLQARWQSAVSGLEQLRARLHQTQAAGNVGPIRTSLISPADALDRSISIRLLASGLFGLVGGLLAGLGLVYATETRDRGYAEAGQAERDLGIPCVGILPGPAHPKQDDDRRVRDLALRSLINRVGLSDPAMGRQLVVLGSALPGEVQSGLARELAALLAQAGRRVVLVEPSAVPQGHDPADPSATLPRPMIATAIAHQVDAGGHHPGMEDADPTARLVPLFEEPEQLLAWLEANAGPCDVVLVQAPAILMDARAAILARAANLFILTVAWHRTPRAALALAVEQLCVLPRPLATIVFAFTQVDLARHDAFGPRDALYFQHRYLSQRPHRRSVPIGTDFV